jgi:hypothetical protein
MPLTAGTLIYRLRPYLPGWRLALVIAFIPMADGIGNGAAAWPVWTALNRSAPLWMTHLAWLVTLGLALTFVWVLSFVVGRSDDEVHVKSKLELLKAALGGSIDESELATASA